MIQIGVDLGSVRCRVAYVTPRGVPALVPDAEDAACLETPSVVVLEEDSALVGQAAAQRLADEPGWPAIEDVKSLLGRAGSVHVDAYGRSWSVRAAAALLLRKLVRDCAAGLNETVSALAIGVPRSFGDDERSALRDAARLAALPEPLLVDELAAAALHLAPEGDAPVLVCDVGGELIEVAVVQPGGEALPEVRAARAVAGEAGRAVDRRLAERLADSFREQFGEDPMADRAAGRELLRVAQEARARLGAGEPVVRRSAVVRGRVFDFALTADHLAAALRPCALAFQAAVDGCLRDAGLAPAEIGRAIVTGGAAGPLFARLLVEGAGISGERLVSDAKGWAVAFGAALAAERGAPPRDLSRLHTAHGCVAADLGIRVWDAERSQPGLRVVIPKGSRLPCERTTVVYTTRADQDRIALDVVERDASGALRPVERVQLGPLGLPGKNHPVEVSFRCGLDGTLAIAAKDTRSGQGVERLVEDQGDALNEELVRVRRLRVNE